MVPPQRCAKKANAKLATSKLVNTKSAKTILANATVANSYWGRAGVILNNFKQRGKPQQKHIGLIGFMFLTVFFRHDRSKQADYV